MKRKIGTNLISKELAISAGIGVIIGILVLSYAANNNLNKMQDIEEGHVLYDLAQGIFSARDSGAIDNKGVANSLASKVMAAYKALGEEPQNTDAAVAALEDLISHVEDQSGKHIIGTEASLLIGLAMDAIEDIQPTAQSCDGEVMDDGSCCQVPKVIGSNGICCEQALIVSDGSCCELPSAPIYEPASGLTLCALPA